MTKSSQITLPFITGAANVGLGVCINEVSEHVLDDWNPPTLTVYWYIVWCVAFCGQCSVRALGSGRAHSLGMGGRIIDYGICFCFHVDTDTMDSHTRQHSNLSLD